MLDRFEESEASYLGIAATAKQQNIYDGQGKIIAESAVDMAIYWHVCMNSFV